MVYRTFSSLVACCQRPMWRRAAIWTGWALVVWVVVFWRLGYASFWDPDEAVYAAATSEMRARGDWLAPFYNGVPFFDKPILFYLLQLASFIVFGETEFSARLVPALSTVALLVVTYWIGTQFFGRATARVSTLMLALLPATFALSSYAILDMTFTMLLFGGLAMLAVAALRARPGLQYGGYLLLACAVLTKGPVALVLAGIAFLLAMAIAPAARRPLWQLHWGRGLGIVIVVAAPWFLYMMWRFDGNFVEGYFLRENVWLFSRRMYIATSSRWFYVRVVAVGMLPWTPLLIGRLVDIARGLRPATEERLLWAFAASVIGFFSVSEFRLDHYVYPAAPALCLLGAREWIRLREGPIGPHWGTAAGAALVPAITAVSGVALAVLISRVPLDLSPIVAIVPLLLIGTGIWLLVQLVRSRFRTRFPVGIAASLLVAYAVVLVVALPRLEVAKPVKRLARETAALATEPGTVAAYHVDRWNSSWRFYIRSHVRRLDTEQQLRDFMSESGARYCLMLRSDYESLAGVCCGMHIILERPGLFVTTGRALRRDRHAAWSSFIVVSNTTPPQPELEGSQAYDTPSR